MRLSQGTVSVLLGCHSQVHSLLVLMAWVKLYHSLPSWWQVVCILVHDVGHWGKDYLDDYEEKKKHGLLGARIAKKLFGQKGYDLVMGHNLYKGHPKSALHDPDKYSWLLAPVWWLIITQVFEPELQRGGSAKRESAQMWKEAMRVNMESGFKKLGHEVYLEQPRQSRNL